MLAGDVLEATGDPLLALQAIGDADARQAQRYLKKRDDRTRKAFDARRGSSPRPRPSRAGVESATEPQRQRGA